MWNAIYSCPFSVVQTNNSLIGFGIITRNMEFFTPALVIRTVTFILKFFFWFRFGQTSKHCCNKMYFLAAIRGWKPSTEEVLIQARVCESIHNLSASVLQDFWCTEVGTNSLPAFSLWMQIYRWFYCNWALTPAEAKKPLPLWKHKRRVFSLIWRVLVTTANLITGTHQGHCVKVIQHPSRLCAPPLLLLFCSRSASGVNGGGQIWPKHLRQSKRIRTLHLL